MALSDQQIAELTALKAARSRLISGQAVAKVSSGGRSVEYAAGSLDKLEQDIAAIEAVASPRRGRAIGFRL